MSHGDKITRVVFGVMNPMDIIKQSVCEVTNHQMFDKKVPRENGPLDMRMGRYNQFNECLTCHRDTCPGHFGHMQLAKAVFHPAYIGMIVQLLNCVCYKCGRFRIAHMIKDLTYLDNMISKDRFREVVRLCNNMKICSDGSHNDSDDGEESKDTGCQRVHPKYKREVMSIVCMKSRLRKVWTAQMALNLITRISDSDLRLMGFNTTLAHPAWMIITQLPVAPLPIRPTISFQGNTRSEDSLTYKYSGIVAVNEKLKKQLHNQAGRKDIGDAYDELQDKIARLIDSKVPGMKKEKSHGSHPPKGIQQRFVGKEGRIRGNLMGKRVDFASRAVITPDPNLSIKEVGIPKTEAMILTRGIRVNDLNREELQEYVNNGPDVYPGANFVIRPDESRVDLNYKKHGNHIHLQNGYIVERHIIDGDLALFNRQPTLHKPSMMVHYIRVLPGATFRLNPANCAPYNADFDGDEMNLHIPQNEHTCAEAAIIMNSSSNILSPHTNKPIIAPIQDVVVGISGLTRRNTFIRESVFMNCVSRIKDFNRSIPPPAVLKPERLWTGKQLMSLIIPNMNLRKESNDIQKRDKTKPYDKLLCHRDRQVIIQNGQLISGTCDKGIIGAMRGGIIHQIALDYGDACAQKFIDQLYCILSVWLSLHGYSIGLNDCTIDNENKKKIQGIIERAKIQAANASSEKEAQDILNNTRDDVSVIAINNLSLDNHLRQIVESGAKGSTVNISQLMSCVGQQNIAGKRVPTDFDKNRSLSCYAPDDTSAESRGFISNSYVDGLTPNEFFFHAKAGREGVIDTAVKTSETGYIQRRLVKSMEDNVVQYDYTVRDSRDNVIQFTYGYDSMDCKYLEECSQPMFDMDDDVFVYTYQWDVVENTALMNQEYMTLISVREAINETLETAESDYPMRLVRCIERVNQNSPLINNELPTPDHVIQYVNVLIQKCKKIVYTSDGEHMMLFEWLIRATLSSKRVIREFRCSLDAFNNLMDMIYNQYIKRMIQPGECVGVLSAQSIGEPATQLTLNTFHGAGTLQSMTTVGVPRLKELVGVSKDPKTTNMELHFTPDVHKRFNDKRKSNDTNHVLKITDDSMTEMVDIRQKIIHRTLKSIMDTCDIYYDPDPMNTRYPVDREWVSEYFELLMMDDEDLAVYSPWVIRIILKKNALHYFEMSHIQKRINECHDQIMCLTSSTNSEHLVLHIRVQSESKEEHVNRIVQTPRENIRECNTLRTIMNHKIANLYLSGVVGIDKLILDEKSNKWYMSAMGMNIDDLSLIHGIDANKVYTNDIHTVYKRFGIEAGRNALKKELLKIISFRSSDMRHIDLLCDNMTHTGGMLPVTRYGMNIAEDEPLKQSAFEKSNESLTNAAKFGITDNLIGVSSRIMYGKRCKIGTGMMDVLLDESMLKDAIPQKSSVQKMKNVSYGEGLSYADLRNVASQFQHVPLYEPTQENTAQQDFNPFGIGAQLYTHPSPQENIYSPTNPGGIIASPVNGGMYSPSSPAFQDTSNFQSMYSPSSPAMNISSPFSSNMYSPSAPTVEETHEPDTYSPSSPAFTGENNPFQIE
jgi:DNA-directed RNA polymerase II subunit RPB1